MNFEKNYKNEFGRYNRHNAFLKYMIENRYIKNIDWDIYWSWYYHSNINEKEALEKSEYYKIRR